MVNVKFELDMNKEYRGEIDKISLLPHDSYYENIFNNMSKDKPMTFKIYREDKCPVYHFTNCRLIYLSRVLKELTRFNKEVSDSIAKQAETVLDLSVNEPDSLSVQSQEIPEEKTTPIFKLYLDDSCLVVPRDSTSKDVVIIMSNCIRLTRST